MNEVPSPHASQPDPAKLSEVEAPRLTPEWRIENRVGAGRHELLVLEQLLTLAAEARIHASSPMVSNFPVGAAGICSGARLVPCAANYEVSDDAKHSEDSLVSNMLARYGSDARLEMVAVTTKLPVPASPCGRCRGVLEAYAASPDMIVGSGTTLNTATTWRLSELLPKQFSSQQFSDLTPEYQELCARALEASERGLQILTKDTEGTEGAAALTDKGTLVQSARVNLAAFYGSSAMESLVNHLHCLETPWIKALAYASDSGIPRPEERQWIFEAANLIGRHASLPVFLISKKSGTLSLCTPAELLPFAFGPCDLGEEVERLARARLAEIAQQNS